MKSTAFLLFAILGISTLLSGCAGTGGTVKDTETQEQTSEAARPESSQEKKAPKATETQPAAEEEPECD